jgi:hypothetical protein
MHMHVSATVIPHADKDLPANAALSEERAQVL